MLVYAQDEPASEERQEPRAVLWSRRTSLDLFRSWSDPCRGISCSLRSRHDLGGCFGAATKGFDGERAPAWPIWTGRSTCWRRRAVRARPGADKPCAMRGMMSFLPSQGANVDKQALIVEGRGGLLALSVGASAGSSRT